jgi:hypothetical protein
MGSNERLEGMFGSAIFKRTGLSDRLAPILADLIDVHGADIGEVRLSELLLERLDREDPALSKEIMLASAEAHLAAELLEMGYTFDADGMIHPPAK